MTEDKEWNSEKRSYCNCNSNRNLWPILTLIVTIVLSPSFMDMLKENNQEFINPESDPVSFTDSITTTVTRANSELGIDKWEFVETTNVVKSGSNPASFTDSIVTTITKA